MDKHEALDLYRSMCGEEEQKSAGEPVPKFCSHCGRINDTGGRICSFCRESAKNSKKRRMAGERLRRPKGEASCQICGKLSVPGEKYCRRCLDFAPGGYVGEPSAKASILPDNSAKANFSGENRSATIENPGVTDKKRSDIGKNESGARLCTRCGKPCDTGGKRCSTCRDYMRGNVAANREKAKQEVAFWFPGAKISFAIKLVLGDGGTSNQVEAEFTEVQAAAPVSGDVPVSAPVVESAPAKHRIVLDLGDLL